ncbi:MAG TPA: hypothetical protein VHD56_03160 [Tepidisphaeraceae bacterium]|nr:hypothetical protein [Tepidisphaeraceae bacterium]
MRKGLRLGWCGVTLLLMAGCISRPVWLSPQSRTIIDRKLVEIPAGYVLRLAALGLTAPSAITIVKDEGPYKGSTLVAESGDGGNQPRIYGWKADGSFFNVYPRGQKLPLVEYVTGRGEIYSPIGGMVAALGRVFVTHRDAKGRGVVSCVGFDGSISTVVADLPAQGDYSLTDITYDSKTGRLYFGLGSATNSGVVGIDNWSWITEHPSFSDLPAVEIKLLGYKFFTRNPNAGFFGGDDNVGTAPFHPFGISNRLRIQEAPNGKPTSAIYSISPTGGDLRVEVHGIRLPRGLAFNEYSLLYATNNGMELRGTRPVKLDPDVLLKVIQNTWYGWPDYSADLKPISDPLFQEPALISRSGYPELSALIDRAASKLFDPVAYRDTLVFGIFPSLSGTAKLDFVPSVGGFKDFRGSAIIAQMGDRAPLSNGGMTLKENIGRKILRVDMETKRTEEFIHNTEGIPASKLGRNVDALERPIDVKFGGDGKLYILDYGRMEIRDGREKISAGSGRIFILEPIEQQP